MSALRYWEQIERWGLPQHKNWRWYFLFCPVYGLANFSFICPTAETQTTEKYSDVLASPHNTNLPSVVIAEHPQLFTLAASLYLNWNICINSKLFSYLIWRGQSWVLRYSVTFLEISNFKPNLWNAKFNSSEMASHTPIHCFTQNVVVIF